MTLTEWTIALIVEGKAQAAARLLSNSSPDDRRATLAELNETERRVIWDMMDRDQTS